MKIIETAWADDKQMVRAQNNFPLLFVKGLSLINNLQAFYNNFTVSLPVVVVSSVILFIVGVVGGFTGGALVVYCCGKTRHRIPHQLPPAPLYEDIVMTTTTTTTQKQRQELKLQDNVAYWQI